MEFSFAKFEVWGFPVVAMPMHLDQPLNARLVEEVGVGVEVERDENGKINREAIAQVIRKVVVGESGEGVRIKAREFSDRIGMRREEAIGEVVEELVKICEEKLVKNSTSSCKFKLIWVKIFQLI